MDFKLRHLKTILLASLIFILFIGLLIWKSSLKADTSSSLGEGTISPIRQELEQENILKLKVRDPLTNPALAKEPILDDSKRDDAEIQEQLNRDRQEQKQTKYLKNKLEQT